MDVLKIANQFGQEKSPGGGLAGLLLGDFCVCVGISVSISVSVFSKNS